jgi:hypothetical protein
LFAAMPGSAGKPEGARTERVATRSHIHSYTGDSSAAKYSLKSKLRNAADPEHF